MADALPELLLTLDMHVMVKVSVSEAPVMTALGSVIVTLPVVGRALFGQPSFDPPPALTQLVAFCADQVSVVACPVDRVVGEAVIVTATGAQPTSTGGASAA